jgi:hypothetical protein
LKELDRVAAGLVQTEVSRAYWGPETSAQNRHDVRMLPELLRGAEKRKQLLRK